MAEKLIIPLTRGIDSKTTMISPNVETRLSRFFQNVTITKMTISLRENGKAARLGLTIANERRNLNLDQNIIVRYLLDLQQLATLLLNKI